MRLHELAKEIGIPSKKLLSLSREIGLNIKSHSSNLAAGEESILRIAMKQELEEIAAVDKAKKTAEAEKQAKKEKKEEKEQKKAEAEARGEAEQEEGTESESDTTTVEDGKPTDISDRTSSPDGAEAGLVEDKVLAEAEGEGSPTVAKDTKEVKESPETMAMPPTSAETEIEQVEKVEPKLKLKPKIKKMPPRRPGATILGRIDLKPMEDRKKASARDTRPKRVESKGSESTDAGEVPDIPLPISPGDSGRAASSRGVVDDAFLEEKNGKVKKFIKPKQQPVVFDPEEDPLLQGIRIRHWNRQVRPKRTPWRPGNRTKKKFKKPDLLVHRTAQVVPPISVKELSLLLGIKVQELLVSIMKHGTMAHINSLLDEEAVLQIAVDFNRDIEIVEEKDIEKDYIEEQELAALEEEDGVVNRAPVVTFLGHVDHGKTSLLDAIRHANVASSEDGGITQHVSAYKVETQKGQHIVFLDTPGHKAFTEMRARGANATDIVVLVVAADDGVMPQTEEAIQHALAADVSIVVAINKIDKQNANPQRVKQQLAGKGIMTEDWGGEVGCVEVSAVTKEGLSNLLDRIALEAEIQELRGNPNVSAQGVVIEARKDVEIGNVVTVLLQDGTLRIRDWLLAGEHICRIRAMTDDRGRSIEEAGPSTPLNVIGFEDLPGAGETFIQVESAAKARELAAYRKDKARTERIAPDDHYAITLENLFASIEAGKVKEIRVVLKADVKGTLEVLQRSLSELTHDEVKVKVLRDGLGAITEDDVLLAVASNAVIVGFHVLPEEKARRLADENSIEIRTYRVIYQLIDDLHKAMEGELEPLKKEVITAHLEIREVFKSSRLGNIAGCIVSDGTIHRNDGIRVIRKGEVLFTGSLSSLKRFKDDHREIKEGFECGVKVSGFDSIQPGDIIESFSFIEEKRTLELDS
ncbi:MAG: translation initiation factor IF-2 [Planctomycetota bacterium]